MPFRIKGNELIEKLRKAKEEEIAAIERLQVYMKSHSIDVAHLKKLTREMVEHCERSTAIWRELHNLTPADGRENS
jgi:hypothetical protein